MAERENGDIVVLLHGFMRTGRNMAFLSGHFNNAGYRTLSPNLPLYYKSLDECTAAFERFFFDEAGNYGHVHFIGHSMGGLIIRNFLSRNNVVNSGRSVLIGTPNQGSDLVGIVEKYAPFIMKVIKPYIALRPGGPAIPPPINFPSPEIGAIAGNKSNLILSRLMSRDNDGRVAVAAVPFEGMKDFIVLPYNHDEIHHKKETAILIMNFIKTGSFK
jgi:alpha-beta hydrolase superfamily lysophospholipase